MGFTNKLPIIFNTCFSTRFVVSNRYTNRSHTSILLFTNNNSSTFKVIFSTQTKISM